jgi:uncharacterized membrane protein
MDSAFAVGLLTCVFLGALMLLVPHFSPRRYFFGITVPPDFRNTEPARRAMREYHGWVGAAICAAIALLRWPSIAPFFAPLLIVATACIEFLRMRARIRPYAAPSAPPDPHIDGGHLPGWMALAAVPYAVLLLVAAYLRAHWDEIPARFPVHWGANGEPNGWSEKTVRGVYGPLMFGAGISLLMLMLALGTWYGSRPSRMRKPMLAILISATYVLTYAFTMVSLLPLIHVGPLALMVPILAYVVVVIAWSFKLNAENEGEPTPDARWIGGAIYYNPGDPAIFVQKRFGVGYTINFGNHRSWLYLGLFLAGLFGLIFLLPR